MLIVIGICFCFFAYKNCDGNIVLLTESVFLFYISLVVFSFYYYKRKGISCRYIRLVANTYFYFLIIKIVIWKAAILADSKTGNTYIFVFFYS